jgi:alkaline phosphatase D
LAPSPLDDDGHGGMPNANVDVQWQLATDERFANLVAGGTAVARYDAAHSVHVEVGGLAADAEYFYRFRTRRHTSPVGRTRTAPAPGRSGELSMAFTSCAHYEHGYFTVYRRMANDRPDVILHLGDYIYESGAKPGRPRRHTPDHEIATLADYRVRHALHKMDTDLQLAHAVAPWLVVWDDHEVENNYAGLVRERDLPNGGFPARRAAAYQAYYEHMPLRATSRPAQHNMQLYRRVGWGSLATFHLLDTRQYRDDQACGDGWAVCPQASAAERTITGAAQERWLLDGLGQHLGTWDIMAQQVFFARLIKSDGTTGMDGWDGYVASRDRIQRAWVERAVRNPVVLTGDVHAAYANNLLSDYTRQDAAPIGTELVTSSASSGGNGPGAAESFDAEGETVQPEAGSLSNRHIRFHSRLRGYVRTRISPQQMTVDFRAVDRIDERGHRARTLASFAVAEGRPGLQPL